MKASELVKKLEAIILLYGDANVEVNEAEVPKMVIASCIEPFSYEADLSIIGDKPHRIVIT